LIRQATSEKEGCQLSVVSRATSEFSFKSNFSLLLVPYSLIQKEQSFVSQATSKE
jgi:hypothetical protein